jgi:hypothetical protein
LWTAPDIAQGRLREFTGLTLPVVVVVKGQPLRRCGSASVDHPWLFAGNKSYNFLFRDF